MSTEANIDWLAKAQHDVGEARAILARALTAREGAVRKAHADGFTIYRIAKTLGLTQGAVRKMLGL